MNPLFEIDFEMVRMLAINEQCVEIRTEDASLHRFFFSSQTELRDAVEEWLRFNSTEQQIGSFDQITPSRLTF